jgi:hypothetical protein
MSGCWMTLLPQAHTSGMLQGTLTQKGAAVGQINSGSGCNCHAPACTCSHCECLG